MVNQAYIRKRKTRRIVAAVGCICAAVAIVIGAIALLGQRASPLTISLTQSGAKLELKEKDDSEEGGKTFLIADDVPDYTPFSEDQFTYFESKYGNLDDQNTYSQFTYLKGKESSTIYFKYTFFVSNVGKSDASYDLRLNFSNPTKDASNRYEIDSILRVRFYENSDDEHNYLTYAKKSATPHTDEDGNISYKEKISGDESGYAEPFVSNSVILTSHVDHFPTGQMMRYTFVFWLEGEDPECQGEPPVDSSLILGVELSAHEADTTPAEE